MDPPGAFDDPGGLDDRRRRRRDDVQLDYDDRPSRPPIGRAGYNLALASMIVGIVSVVLSLVGWVMCWPGMIGTAVFGTLPILFGIIARLQGSRSRMVAVGILCGLLAILISGLMAVLAKLMVAWLIRNRPPGQGPGMPGI